MKEKFTYTFPKLKLFFKKPKPNILQYLIKYITMLTRINLYTTPHIVIHHVIIQKLLILYFYINLILKKSYFNTIL